MLFYAKENPCRTEVGQGIRIWVTARLFANVGQEGNVSGAFYSDSQLSLMTSAGTGNTPRDDLSAVRQLPFQSRNIFVIDLLNFIHAESANFFAGFSAASFISFGSFHET